MTKEELLFGAQNAEIQTVQNDNMSNLRIVNLSNKILDNDELSLLSKGRNFCPTQGGDFSDVHVDLFKIIRLLKLKDFFSNRVVTQDTPVCSQEGSVQTITDVRNVQCL